MNKSCSEQKSNLWELKNKYKIIRDYPLKTSSDFPAPQRYTLGPQKFVRLGDIEVRIQDDVRCCVAFLGYMYPDDGNGMYFKPHGTAFFQGYGGVTYLVTAKHVARSLTPPISIRASRPDGTSVLIEDAYPQWFFHPDPNVDLAIVVGITDGALAIPEEMLLTSEKLKKQNIGVGNEVHIVGLYRIFPGQARNFPVVHTGHIAMAPPDECVPMIDRNTQLLSYVNAYLIEAQTLEGLSGSPVFVRHSWELRQGDRVAFMHGDIALLGMWISAWDAPPAQILSVTHRDAQKVPVGMGLAMPSEKMIELFNLDEVRSHRKGILERERAALSDSDPIPQNPRHKEDFIGLLDAAARKPKQDD